MEINQVVKDLSAQQAAAYQKMTQQTVLPPAATDNKTLTLQAVQATEKSSDSVQIKYSATSKNLDTVSAIEQIHARLNLLAKGVRETNEGLNSASLSIDKMQTTLEGVVKNFPPFSVNSPERQKILMSYFSLRKEIEKLMVPPPPAPVYEKVEKMWGTLFTGSKLSETAVPAIDPSSSDSQVGSAVRQLAATGENLSALSDSITKALVQS